MDHSTQSPKGQHPMEIYSKRFGSWIWSQVKSGTTKYILRIDEDNRIDGTDGKHGTESSDGSMFIVSLEKHLIMIQSLLLWDNPKKTLMALSVFNMFYWALVVTSRSLMSMFFLTLITGHLYNLWTNCIWPEIRVPPTEDQKEAEDWMPVHPTALSAPEILGFMNRSKKMLISAIDYLIDFRKRRHGLFCLGMTSFFMTTGIIGQKVSGSVLLYGILMSLALTPGIYLYIIPSGFMDFMRSLASPFSKNPHDDEEDVFAQHDYPDSDVRKVSTSGAAATCDFKFIQSQAQNVFSCFQTTPGISHPEILKEKLAKIAQETEEEPPFVFERELGLIPSESTAGDNNGSFSVSPEVSVRSSQKDDDEEESDDSVNRLRLASTKDLLMESDPDAKSGNSDSNSQKSGTSSSSGGIKIHSSHFDSPTGSDANIHKDDHQEQKDQSLQDTDDDMLDDQFEIVTESEIDESTPVHLHH